MATTTQKLKTATQKLKMSQLEIGDKFRFSESGIMHVVKDKSRYFVDYSRINDLLFQQWWFVSEDKEVYKFIED